jgi:hypothetical protein
MNSLCKFAIPFNTIVFGLALNFFVVQQDKIFFIFYSNKTLCWITLLDDPGSLHQKDIQSENGVWDKTMCLVLL